MENENFKRKNIDRFNFDSVGLRLASPEKILEWSYGEVTKPETINYRTQRSEKGGLFDEKIFGPEKDFECYCGKYRGVRYKGIICEKCGVEVTRAIVRRERMGHIELASPVSHIWFLKSIPSRMGMLLNLSANDLEKVIYFAGYIITKVNEEERKKFLKDVDSEYKSKIKGLKDSKSKDKLKELFLGAKKEINSIQGHKVLDSIEYNKFSVKYGTLFEAETGAEAVYEIFKNLDLKKLAGVVEKYAEEATATQKPKISKRLSLLNSMVKSGVRPEWMFFTRIPVIPPAIRPMVALDGGRHATSDVNDLYRRVINRNNRLKKLMAINAPNVIVRNEKRILQEAVDALIDNSIKRGTNPFSAMSQAQRRPLKSLSDNLKGKQGLFRQNLLGKRVDYSGRSVIVVGPELALDECGLPKHMALELFRPFVIEKLLNRELAFNIRGANKLIDDGIPEVWAMLEEVIEGKYVLLNRAPTLHRLGIQAFRPILIEGSAIQVHPLVCTAFNADFDGDQMAVHVPLSNEAQMEAREIMASDKNLLNPGSGKPVASAKMLDIILGCYWMTKIIPGKPGEDKFFSTPNSALTAYDFGDIDFRAKIKVMASGKVKYQKLQEKVFETSAGRLLFNSVLPDDYPFINEEVDLRIIQRIIDELLENYGVDALPKLLDRIKSFGFNFVTQSGITWGIDDIKIPEGKKDLIEKGKKEMAEIRSQFDDGLLSEEERYRKTIEIWTGIKSEIEALIPETLDTEGSVYDMVNSGARGSLSQLTQMVGMKGLIASTSGETIDFPVLSSSKEGFNPIEYFISTHGSRKGLADTALGTAKSGYLTRRLFDVAQDVVITEIDCKTKDGVWIRKEEASGIEIPLSKNLKGRILAEDVKGPKGKVLLKKGELVTENDAKEMEDKGVLEALIRSPMTCKSKRGICKQCYGIDLGNNLLVDLGESVGTVAAQAIGEPGTQLTMRTFHAGGTASKGGDITAGLPRIEEVFERRIPKNAAVISRIDGKISEIKNEEEKEKVIIILPDIKDKPKGKQKKSETEYKVHFRRSLLAKKGEDVKKGQLLTDGSANLQELFKYAGREATQNYIIHEINKIYELQGASISRKHIEIMVRQMFSRSLIKDPGETLFSEGDVVENTILEEENKNVKEQKLAPAKAEPLILGITEVSLTRKSFLSAASFQHTNKILINAAVRGTEDNLVGLKENVIIGRLIPAGTGFPESPKFNQIQEIQKELEERRSDFEE